MDGETAVVSGEKATFDAEATNRSRVFVSTCVRRGERWVAVGSIYP